MGRPPKPPEERRDAKHQITVRLSEDERAHLESLTVELRSTSVGETIRRALAELYERTFRAKKR